MSAVPSGAGEGGDKGGISGFAVGGAVLGGVSSFFQARAARKATKLRNKAILKSLALSQRRINDFITQVQVDVIRNTEQVSRMAQTLAGSMLNQAPEGQSAIETIAARVVAGAASDTFAIGEEARRRFVAADAEKQNLVAQASSQMTPLPSVLAGTVQGAVGGAQQGLQLEGQLSQAQSGADIGAARLRLLNEQGTTQGLYNSFLIGNMLDARERNENIASSLESMQVANIMQPFGQPGPSQ